MKILGRITFALAVLLTSVGATCQNGPNTPAPSVVLTWTQAASPNVTANCVYRGTVADTYTLPAIYCSTSPITTYTDTTVVRGTTYHYAVTAKYGTTTESGYSNDATAAVPTYPAPTLGAPTETKLEKSHESMVLAAAIRWR